MRPHGRAEVDRDKPRAWAICDRCGFLYNHYMLRWQFQWTGPRTANQNLLVCDRCMDVPQEQLRTFRLPADPPPIENSRVERTAILNNPMSPIGTPFGTMTQAAGVKAAFDSNTNKPFAFCAATFTSTTSNTVGVNFGSSQDSIVASSFTATAPNNAPFLGSGSTTWSFQGSNAAAGFTVIASGNTAGTIGEVLAVQLNPVTNYQYYQLVLGGNNVNSVAIAQLKISQTG
jgi:hypothetical protein